MLLDSVEPALAKGVRFTYKETLCWLVAGSVRAYHLSIFPLLHIGSLMTFRERTRCSACLSLKTNAVIFDPLLDEQ